MADPLSIKRLYFQAGPRPGGPPLIVDGSRAIVLVGPNNSGKSMALRELEEWGEGQEVARSVIAEVEVEWPSYELAMSILRQLSAPSPGPIEAGSLYISVAKPGRPNGTYEVNPNALANWLADQKTFESALCSTLMQPTTVRLDGRGRFALAEPQPSGDLQQSAQNHLWRLLQEDDSRERVRDLVKAAFGLYFFIDGTAMTEFRVRLAQNPPSDEIDELSFRPEARDFASRAPMLEEFGDGVQTFVGLLSALLGLPARLILVDEPEAFLHQVLSRRLGSNLVELAEDREGTLIVATHSPSFLMGCIEQSPDAVVVRLTFENEVPTARALSPDQLSELMHDPLLRSTGALEGLFHRAVIITESDNDRAFYGEINRRLVLVGRGIPDSQFVNAQNWQTTARLMAPLRAVGIPAAGIIDFDALASSESWNPFFKAMGLEEQKRAELGQRKAACAARLSAVGKNAYKSKGLDALQPPHRAEVEDFLTFLSEHGLFVVSVGEVEGWLADLEVPGSKTQWAVKMLERLGSDASSEEWVSPSDNDVWQFLDSVGQWVDDPARKGIPD